MVSPLASRRGSGLQLKLFAPREDQVDGSQDISPSSQDAVVEEVRGAARRNFLVRPQTSSFKTQQSLFTRKSTLQEDDPARADPALRRQRTQDRFERAPLTDKESRRHTQQRSPKDKRAPAQPGLFGKIRTRPQRPTLRQQQLHGGTGAPEKRLENVEQEDALEVVRHTLGTGRSSSLGRSPTAKEQGVPSGVPSGAKYPFAKVRRSKVGALKEGTSKKARSRKQ